MGTLITIVQTDDFCIRSGVARTRVTRVLRKILIRCGIVLMGHYGTTYLDDDIDIKVYGDKLN